MDSEAQRLEIYRRCALLTEPAALEALRQELQDRFGPPPPAVERLLLVIEVKLLARQLFLERIEQRGLECSDVSSANPRRAASPAAMVTNHRATLSFSL